jgi:hypothetical protein
VGAAVCRLLHKQEFLVGLSVLRFHLGEMLLRRLQ